MHVRCRDDIIAQPSHRETLRKRAKQADELERALQQLGALMAAHVDDMMKKVRGIAGAPAAQRVDGGSTGVVRTDNGSIDKARALIHAATDAKRLCAQDPIFHPWF